MYHILIVEDSKLLREQLARLMSEELPASEIVAAATVEEAIRHIREARKAGKFFLAAVLDVMLPPRQGHAPELDNSVLDALSRLRVGTLIIRFTAFDSDELVHENLKGAKERTLPRVLPISKTEENFSNKIITELKRDRIGRQMADLFGHSPTARVARRGSATLALAMIISDIARFWSDLDEKDREPIRRFFDVDEDHGDIRVKLGGTEAEENDVEA